MGAVQSTLTICKVRSKVVVGAAGCPGEEAARMSTSFEYPTLKSNAVLDLTLKV